MEARQKGGKICVGKMSERNVIREKETELLFKKGKMQLRWCRQYKEG